MSVRLQMYKRPNLTDYESKTPEGEKEECDCKQRESL